MKIKKSVLTLALALAVVFGIMVGANAADTLKTISAYLNYGITVKYNGDVQVLKDANGNRVYPISYEGTTYLPVRAVANLLGIEVNWDGATNTVWLGEGFIPTTESNTSGQTNTGRSQTSKPSSGGKSYYGGFSTYEEYINDLHNKYPDISIEDLKEGFPDQATGQIGEAAAGDKKDGLEQSAKKYSCKDRKEDE